MKKILLTIMALVATVASVNAQTWNMVITHQDGTIDTIATSAVKNVRFFLPDQNVDQVIIKELYAGGCMKDDGTTKFQRDKGVVLYNNCGETAVINNLCFGMGNANAQAGSAKKNYDSEGNFVPDTYATPFQPSWAMVWYYPGSLVIEPYSQVVVSFMGSIDNTQTISNSVNYANADYYCMYDPEAGWTSDMSTSYYPTPSDLIPASHYFKGVMFSQGSAWAFSVTSPSVFIYQTKGISPADFANDTETDWYTPGYENSLSFRCKQVPQDWVIDGMEVFSSIYETSEQYKRLSSKIDAGYVMMTNYQGHSLYRNVDKEATLAIEGNSDLLVYDYSLGVNSSTDPSGIDAEASIKNGAKIVYQDTNNSANDFHERQCFSIRGK